MNNQTNDKNWCVYIHTNKSNNKVYIGITSRNPADRWGFNGYKYHKNQPVFYRAIKKYGWDNFDHIIFADHLVEDEAKHMEVLLIALYKSNCTKYKNPSYGYNMTDGGDGSAGRIISEETRQKMRDRATGRVFSLETRAKLSEQRKGENGSFFGKHHSENTKNIISTKAHSRLLNPTNHPMYGKHHSVESNKKNMESQSTRRAVCQFDLEGNYIATFPSLSEASRITGVSRNSITLCCHREIKSTKGFVFNFLDEQQCSE
jgi:group I intron endonuclease